MNAEICCAGADTGNSSRDELQRQLYRYAQDLQELMQQYSALQQRNQIMRQALGGGDQASDLVLGLMTQSNNPYLVTDMMGKVTFASPAAIQQLTPLGKALLGQSIVQLAPIPQQPLHQVLLDQLTTVAPGQAIELRTLVLADGVEPQIERDYMALIMPINKRDRTELFWFLFEQTPSGGSAQMLQGLLPILGDNEEGVLVVAPMGSIQAVNPAFSRITGYSAQEVLGKNPRLLNAGLQDSEFYQGFWQQLWAEGCWSGEVFNRRKNGQVYFEWLQVKAVKGCNGETLAFLGVFADKTPRENDHRELAHLAFHDTLTGLPNSRLFDTCLARALTQAQSEQASLGLLLLDLNRFKLVYNNLDHAQIDQVLLAVSAHLQAAVRHGDVVARIGDDEFAILLPLVDTSRAIEDMANYILYLMEAPIQVGSQAVALKVNIGCARFPQDGADAPGLLRCADAAMYAARQFDLRFCFFDHATVGIERLASGAPLMQR